MEDDAEFKTKGAFRLTLSCVFPYIKTSALPLECTTNLSFEQTNGNTVEPHFQTFHLFFGKLIKHGIKHQLNHL